MLDDWLKFSKEGLKAFEMFEVFLYFIGVLGIAEFLEFGDLIFFEFQTGILFSEVLFAGL